MFLSCEVLLFFLHQDLLVSSRFFFSSSHPILTSEGDSSSSSPCCTTSTPKPREEEEERKSRSRLGANTSSSSHRRVLSSKRKEEYQGGGGSMKKEQHQQQSRLPVVDISPSCMQRKKLLSTSHLRSKSTTRTIARSSLNAKRRSLSLLHQKKERGEDFLSFDEKLRSVSSQEKSKKQRTYLGPPSEPGGVIKVVGRLKWKKKEKGPGVYTPRRDIRNAFSGRGAKNEK